MTRIFAILLLLAQASATKVLPATDVKASDIQATVKEEIAKKLTDVPIRTVDAGGHNVSIAVVHRDKGTNLTGMAAHDKVSEVYYVVEGAGTFVTGGTLREWLEFVPEKILFGTDAYPYSSELGWEESGWLAARTGREALARALTAMLRDGEIQGDLSGTDITLERLEVLLKVGVAFRLTPLPEPLAASTS